MRGPSIPSRWRSLPGGGVVEERHDRLLTFEGFITHSQIEPSLIETTRINVPGVFAAIRALFFDQQYDRAAVGEYDRYLVAAYFGLAEKRQVEAKVTVSNLSDEDLDAELLEVVDVMPDPWNTREIGSRSLDHEEQVPALLSSQDRPE